MMLLDFKNVQESIFEDNALRKKLPEFRSLFDSWSLSRQIPALRQLGKRAVMDFMELIEPEHLEIVSEHLNCKVFINRLDYHIVREVSAPLGEMETTLNEFEGYENFSVTRSEKDITLFFWR